MTELSYHAELVSHYRAVKARLWHPKRPTRMIMAPIPATPTNSVPRVPVSLSGAILTLREAELTDLLKLADIMAAVCAVSGLSVVDIKGPSRVRKITYARQLSFFLARRYTIASSTRIGRFCGLKDHTSVLWAYHKITADQSRWQGQIEAALALLGRENERP